MVAGPHGWSLPALDVNHPPGLQRYRLFAMFLLQGKVRGERMDAITVVYCGYR